MRGVGLLTLERDPLGLYPIDDATNLFGPQATGDHAFRSQRRGFATGRMWPAREREKERRRTIGGHLH